MKKSIITFMLFAWHLPLFYLTSGVTEALSQHGVVDPCLHSRLWMSSLMAPHKFLWGRIGKSCCGGKEKQQELRRETS